MRLLIVSVVLLVLFEQIDSRGDFGYEGSEGPDYWSQKYKECAGKHQSPVDIETAHLIRRTFRGLDLKNFDIKLDKANLTNNGHTVQLSRIDGVTPSVWGGPLTGKYNFQQLHFHWGKTDAEGAEHTINNFSYPLELHMVFYKHKYRNFDEALKHPDGLTVLGFLFHIEDKNNPNFISFEDKVKEVQEAQASIDVSGLYSLYQFIEPQKMKSFFTYSGSLTTPPCSEVVTWILCTDTVAISSAQLKVFRNVSAGSHRLEQNFRPIQPLNGRKIYTNM